MQCPFPAGLVAIDSCKANLINFYPQIFLNSVNNWHPLFEQPGEA